MANAGDKSAFQPTTIEEVCRWLYSFLLALLLPLIYGFLLTKNRSKGNGMDTWLKSRFGYVDRLAKKGGYFFHCVSVGEVVSASCVIKAIMQEEPDAFFTITTTTSTGAARVRSLFTDQVQHFYLPYDFQFAMKNMLTRIQPKLVVITEVELWPNLIHASWKLSIPTCVLNARMTDRSARRYAKFPKLFGAMIKKLSHVCAQGERDYRNYLQLGIEDNKLTLTNNVKFDQASLLTERNFLPIVNVETEGRAVVIGGSTHEGEEVALLDAISQLQSTTTKKPLLILVPRHPQRFDSVADLLQQRNENWCRTSQNTKVAPSIDVILLDEMGKLAQVYKIGDIAFVGGSLIDKGGHNALEPAAHTLPIIMGPHKYNNPQICETLEDVGALQIVNNTDELHAVIERLILSPEDRLVRGKAGRDVLMQNKGAVEQTLSILSQLHK